MHVRMVVSWFRDALLSASEVRAVFLELLWYVDSLFVFRSEGSSIILIQYFVEARIMKWNMKFPQLKHGLYALPMDDRVTSCLFSLLPKKSSSLVFMFSSASLGLEDMWAQHVALFCVQI
jgi:hypothetical protein